MLPCIENCKTSTNVAYFSSVFSLDYHFDKKKNRIYGIKSVQEHAKLKVVLGTSVNYKGLRTQATTEIS